MDMYYLNSGRIIVRSTDEIPVAVVTGRPLNAADTEALAGLIVDLLNAYTSGAIVLPSKEV